MTRLKTNDIENIIKTLKEYDKELVEKTGHTLQEIGKLSSEKTSKKVPTNFTFAVIPITTGLGIIGGFSDTVSGILKYLGFNSFVTSKTDVSGIMEAYKKDADAIMLADDDCFLSINLTTKKISENSSATARAYVCALKLIAKDLKEKEVLVTGAGRVGNFAIRELLKLGAKVGVYDIKEEAVKKVLNTFESYDIKVITDLDKAINSYSFIFDASPGDSFITLEHSLEDTIIVAPGMPLCLDENALKAFKSNLIHDPLQLGVATMAFDVFTS